MAVCQDLLRTSARLEKMSAGNRKTMMPHALLIPLPAQGHINPMMHLAWKLVSDGFFITFLSTEHSHQRMIEANKDKVIHHNSERIRMISVPGGQPLEVARGENQINNIDKFLRSVENALGPSVIDKLIQDINEKDEEQKVTCIIADVWTCCGLQPVAELHRVSLAVLNTSLVSTFAIRYFSPKLISLGILPSDGIPKEDTTQTYLPSMPPLQSAHLPWLTGGEYIFRYGNRIGKEAAKIEWVLFNTFYELETGVVDDLSREVGVYPIGPLISPEFLDCERKTSTPSFWEDDMECLEWLDKHSEQSVIYVSFGSHAILNYRQVEELALGLEATQRPFLWVVRADLMDGATAVLPAGFLDRVKDRGCIVSWAPQLRVLSHPSIACFVTHCGWNSVQESITMGVPMICWPYFGDQFLNSTYIVHVWKVGLPLKANNDGLIEKEEFRGAIERLVATEEGKAVREETRKWNSIAKNTVKEGGFSSTSYTRFVKAMMKCVNEMGGG
ncbi:anthocyanidin 3-O-glucosyltransferase 7-like [Cryptomeria japonica]|uniref:anthocyanidin 3-O-glucosyltransferase 7-like n=1 Tax=Cryptomeria japonica TaxID=3369 RepID=UPI0027DA52BE|nr:anthocyanidin 3-O-glucosyltransferase 7-like [Cryptomeria japonica]